MTVEERLAHSGRSWVAVDIDGTLTDASFKEGKIAPLSHRGLQLLEMLAQEGKKVLLFTGHMSEYKENHVEYDLVNDWVRDQKIDHLVHRVWPFPKPHVCAFIDDKAIRWRGDPELSLLEVRSACRWVDAMKEKA